MMDNASEERPVHTWVHSSGRTSPCSCDIGEDHPERAVLRGAGIRNTFDDDAPTGPLTPGQVKCVSCQENERSRAASSAIDGLCTFCRDSGDARFGHQFHFSVMVQGVHRSPDGLYRDEPEPVEYEPFALTVRAWNLAAACRKAAETPLGKWKPFAEGED